MRIESLHFKNITEGWELSETKFDDLNLLVGVSGAGKTQILEAIQQVRRVAFGDPINSKMQWSVHFSIQGIPFIWEGSTQESFGRPHHVGFGNGESDLFIANERLWKDGASLFERTPESITFKGGSISQALLKRSSLMVLFGEDEDTRLIRNGFGRITQSASSDVHQLCTPPLEDSIVQDWLGDDNLEDLKASGTPLLWKIFLVQQLYQDEFLNISAHFMEVFPEVEDVKIVLNKVTALNSGQKFYPALVLSVGQQTVDQSRISSGMLKTFLFLSELILATNGSVFLIDELENSLGVNCLGVVSQLIKRQVLAGRNLQFIITSHHPYIINNIDMKYWKVVTRKGGVIRTLSAEDLKLGRSKHQAFFQLINSDAYLNGVAA